MKNFNKYLVLALALICMCSAYAETTVDSLLNVLDREIAHKKDYHAKKQAEIDLIKEDLKKADGNEELYDVYVKLFHAYKSFNMDSALHYSRHSIDEAKAMGDSVRYWRGQLMEAEAYKNLGLYNQARFLLDSLPPQVGDSLKLQLLERYVSVYYSIAEALPKKDAFMIVKSLKGYRDSLIKISPTEVSRAINQLERLKLNGDYKSAIKLYESLPDSIKHCNGDGSGVFNYVLGQAYIDDGQSEKGLELMLRTAIDDIRRADRKYNALPTVAQALYDRGDVSHAYKYMTCALDDYSAANAQCRMRSVTTSYPFIIASYQAYHKRARDGFLVMMIVVAVFLILFAASLVIIYKKNRALSQDKELLNRYNEELTQLKEKSDSLNDSLKVSARTKEDYIGQLFNLCSDYINLMTHSHSAILKIIKKGNLAEVEKAVAKMDSPERLSSFYVKFDQCFLDLFPDFVEKFNALLDDEYSIDLQQGQMPPELRIFALIRLGVADTSKIASFLHYSTQTVYNYRFRVRSHAKEKDTFFDDVARL